MLSNWQRILKQWFISLFAHISVSYFCFSLKTWQVWWQFYIILAWFSTHSLSLGPLPISYPLYQQLQAGADILEYPFILCSILYPRPNLWTQCPLFSILRWSNICSSVSLFQSLNTVLDVDTVQLFSWKTRRDDWRRLTAISSPSWRWSLWLYCQCTSVYPHCIL